jgi:hypothetical protein
MKTKHAKKTRPEQSGSETKTVVASTPIPDPAALADAAKQEKRVIAARDYSNVIDILRNEKRFSFQKIADWLNARGVPLDNNDVYRVYVANIPGEEKEAMHAHGEEIDPED